MRESQEFLKFVYDADDVLSDLIYATLQYGLRRSEALGITEDSLDFKRHLLKIERTVVVVTSEHKKERTKTPDSNRVYYLTPDMEQFFKKVICKKRENQLFYGDTYIITRSCLYGRMGEQYVRTMFIITLRSWRLNSDARI